VLPQISVRTLHYHGIVDESDTGFSWIFVEEATGHRYSPDDASQRRGAARWLAALHTGASTMDLEHILANRDGAYFLDQLRSAHRAIAAAVANSAFGSVERTVIDRSLAGLELLDSRWADVEALCRRMPRTVVHNDFCVDNLRVEYQQAEPIITAFDWEDAGWGVPVIDFAQLPALAPYSVRPDLEVYTSLVRQMWPALNEDDVRLLSEAGALFRIVSELYWEAWRLSYDYRSERQRAWLTDYVDIAREYVARLHAFTQMAGWP
jgi:aminoglycoside phosphotransferase (APT) family kinase protein